MFRYLWVYRVVVQGLVRAAVMDAVGLLVAGQAVRTDGEAGGVMPPTASCPPPTPPLPTGNAG